ncbi:MAG: hypothetical protein K1Y36_11875 [Blastocatellia bacterium]|nr:hypothetical protein [Blastocatellia bacterium]
MSQSSEFWQVMINGYIYQVDLETLKWWIQQGWVLPADMVRKGNLSWVASRTAPTLRGVWTGTEEIVSTGMGLAPNQMQPVAVVPQEKPPTLEKPELVDPTIALTKPLFSVRALCAWLGGFILLGTLCLEAFEFPGGATNPVYFELVQGKVLLVLILVGFMFTLVRRFKMLWLLIFLMVTTIGIGLQNPPPNPNSAPAVYYIEATPHPVVINNPTNTKASTQFLTVLIQAAGFVFLGTAAWIDTVREHL